MIVKKQSTQKSRIFLYLTLLITVGFTIWIAMNDNDEAELTVVEVTKGNRQRAPFMAKEAQLDLLQQRQASGGSPIFDREPQARPIKPLFTVHSWFVPPPINKAALKAEAPTAPPLPFEYNGKLEGTPKGTLVFLVANDKLYTTVVGENVDAQWRLDTETENALQFTYLPLNLPIELSKAATINSVADRPANWLLKAQNN